jgi:predicted DNA-binding WGR domain protein
MATRRFEFEEGSSSKFWAVERRARTVTVTFGRIGSAGQEKAKSFPTEAKAVHEEERLIAEKLGKGYREVTAKAAAGTTPNKPAARTSARPAAALVRQVERLGGKIRPLETTGPVPFANFTSASFYRSEDGNSWERADPLGQLTHVSEAIAWFDRVGMPNVLVPGYEEDEPDTLECCSASEGWDKTVDGKRRVLFQIAWNPRSQFCYCLDLCDPSPDPAVYSIDHDGSDPGLKAKTLSSFLAAAKRAPARK